MKRNLLVYSLFLFLLVPPLAAQEDVVVVDDEECGCELVFVDGIQTTQDGDFFGFKRADGTVIVDNIYKFVDKFHGNYCKVYRDYGQCGLINRDGHEVVEPRFADVSYPTEGYILVRDTDGYYGFFDTLGRQRIPFSWRAASTFSQGLAVVAVDIDSTLVQYGYIDTDGRMAIAPQFQYAFPFSEGYAVIESYDRYGMIDLKGHEVIPPKYEALSGMVQGLFFGGSPDGLALFGSDMTPLTPFIYDGVVDISENRVLVVRQGLYGFLDRGGDEVIPCRYEHAYLFREGRAAVSLDGRWGIIDTLGREVLPIQYDNSGTRAELYIYHEGRALVEKDGRYGFCDLSGDIVIPVQYRDAYQFSNGLAPVKIDLWGYIDTTGMPFIVPVFDYASPFEYGRAEVIYMGVIHKMDSRGRCVKNCKNAPKSWKQ